MLYLDKSSNYTFVESVSIISQCLHFLLIGGHAGHMVVRGAYHDIVILAQLAVSMVSHSGKSFDTQRSCS